MLPNPLHPAVVHFPIVLVIVCAMGLVVAGAHVGAAGGELVYRHRPAAAYVESAPLADAETRQAMAVEDQDEDEDVD